MYRVDVTGASRFKLCATHHYGISVYVASAQIPASTYIFFVEHIPSLLLEKYGMPFQKLRRLSICPLHHEHNTFSFAPWDQSQAAAKFTRC